MSFANSKLYSRQNSLKVCVVTECTAFELHYLLPQYVAKVSNVYKGYLKQGKNISESVVVGVQPTDLFIFQRGELFLEFTVQEMVLSHTHTPAQKDFFVLYLNECSTTDQNSMGARRIQTALRNDTIPFC